MRLKSGRALLLFLALFIAGLRLLRSSLRGAVVKMLVKMTMLVTLACATGGGGLSVRGAQIGLAGTLRVDCAG